MEIHDHRSYNQLKVKSIGIDTYKEHAIYMRIDCEICNSEGFTALTRLQVNANGQSIVATLMAVLSDLVHHDEAGLSPEAIKRLGVREGDFISVHHLKPVRSFAYVRGKMYNKSFLDDQLMQIIQDVAKGQYSNIELAAFVTACAGDNLSLPEITALTRAMVSAGSSLSWSSPVVLDKHSVGGLPGNRTSPIVVSIIAAAGFTIPKTSSRSITSPAGTADTMEVITRVDLDIESIKKVVLDTGGCLAWGGAMELSPADDILIAIEKALDIESEGQLVASVLSKKAAAGSTHVVIDIPVGSTAKVRNHDDARRLKQYFHEVGESIGLKVETYISDGSQPVGIGIGPALEARDVLSVLKNEAGAPVDLKHKSAALAGLMLEMVNYSEKGKGKQDAIQFIENGKAYDKFKAICLAQGSFREPFLAQYQFDVTSREAGVISEINNRSLAKVAKLAGAPTSPAAGIEFFAPIGKKVNTGDLLFRIHSESTGEMAYSKEYLDSIEDLITIQ